MKRKAVEAAAPVKTTKAGLIATVQQVDTIMVLNVFKDRILQGRYCMSTVNYEYQSFDCIKKEWKETKLFSLIGLEGWYYSSYPAAEKLNINSEEERKQIQELLNGAKIWHPENIMSLIDTRECEYRRNRRDTTEQNRVNRVNAVMRKVPRLPADLGEWITGKAAGHADYTFFDKEKKKWNCTACGKELNETDMKRTDGGKKIRHNDMVECPECGTAIQAKKRSEKQELRTHFMILQPMDSEYSVARHMDVTIRWDKTGRKVYLSEAVRIILNKLGTGKRYACELYYNQYSGVYVWEGKMERYSSFDSKGNPSGRHTYPGYLYEQGIGEALENTCYSAWARLFSQMAAAGKKVHYNKLMIAQNNLSIVGLAECLFKGRFDRLLLETSENVSVWNGEYCGPLKLDGQRIEDAFDIRDRQRINRIRDTDGGEKILEWMRWSDKTGEKIPQEALEWLTGNGIDRKDIGFIGARMGIHKIMNYVKRQQLGEYKGKSAKAVLSQWEDYLNMCQNQKKNMEDEMVYRPRELRRRHDEIVEEINKQEMIERMKRNLQQVQEEAERMREKFPGAEEILEEIKPKYEYGNEEYRIMVPEKLIDIMMEGQALHHCTGATDRYFDRIRQHETYICFLRRTEEPDVPYYTIEVEPGGTIRQHRGYMDEEPGIEKIRGFLREWQQEVKKRMKSKDFRLAEISAQKREENLEELRQKNNTRVLEGLMEDFMEAI